MPAIGKTTNNTVEEWKNKYKSAIAYVAQCEKRYKRSEKKDADGNVIPPLGAYLEDWRKAQSSLPHIRLEVANALKVTPEELDQMIAD